MFDFPSMFKIPFLYSFLKYMNELHYKIIYTKIRRIWKQTENISLSVCQVYLIYRQAIVSFTKKSNTFNYNSIYPNCVVSIRVAYTVIVNLHTYTCGMCLINIAQNVPSTQKGNGSHTHYKYDAIRTKYS